MSKVIAGPTVAKNVVDNPNTVEIGQNDGKSDLNVSVNIGLERECSCKGGNVGKVIDQILNSVSRKGKSVIEINIEIHKLS